MQYGHSDEECEQRRETAKALDLAKHVARKRWAGKGWTPEQKESLGTADDAELAKKFGQSENAVKQRRVLRRVVRYQPKG